MIERFLIWLFPRLKPREGWLPLLLLVAAVGCVTASLVAAQWVPEGSVVGWTGTLGLLLGVLVAKRSFRTLSAWLLLLAYGLVLTTIRLANLVNFSTLLNRDISYGVYFRGQFALFIDKWGGWIRSVFAGGSSQETIVFAFGLGLGIWLLAAYTGWSAFRQKRPLLGLTALGMVVAFNSYYSAISGFWIFAFLILTILSSAILNFANLEQEWLAKKISYADQVKFDLLAAAALVAVFLVAMANFIPSLNVNEWARRFQQSALAETWEDTFGRVFAGVRTPDIGSAPDGLGGAGVLPRSFLLGNPPELAETVVMTATVDSNGTSPLHWRALSYDVYTGRGWSRSEERREAVAADNWLVLPSAAQTVQITQTVSWVFDERAIRYTLGLPFAMDQPMSVRWRGVDDLVRVLGQGDVVYTAFSRGSKATVADLRGAPLATVPPVLLARYTALPNTVPQRVHDLAMEITAGGETPYDKAKAVETFLRQYPYSLDVSAPPAQVDPVDYFLFDLQAGYCDYYASAMVVLLRSAGIPARVGIGYLVQPPDENGVQTVVQLNAHSWAEVYFADYGWIEFEPTAPFASPFPDETDGIDNAGNNETIPPPFDESFVPPPIPDQADAQRPFNWVLWLGVVVGIGGLGIIWFRFAQRQRELDGVALAYEGLQNQARRLGVATPASQTPHEFASAFQAWLVAKEGSYEPDSWWGKRLGMVNAGILQLTQLFVHRQYRGWNPVENVQEANTIWQKIKPSLWQWRIKTQINAFRLRKNKQFLDKHQT